MIAIGKKTVAAAGTPVQVYASSASLVVLRARTILVKALQGNTGTVYVGKSNMVKGTGVGVIGDLVAGGSVNLTAGSEMSFIDAEEIYLDADNNGDGAYVTVIA